MDQAVINNQIAAAHETIEHLRTEVGRVVIGQQAIVDRLVIALLIRGHVLVEGLPGLAKTLLVKTLASAIDGTFKRVQFTPDLLPADITGTMIFDPAGRTFNARLGPIFANFVLGDEINRAPAKVQSALLEAMQERQVTIGDTTYALPDPFVVIATQNPIEHEGTYALPEAQVDRFVMKLKVDYPKPEEEARMLSMYLDPTAEMPAVRRVLPLSAIREI
ncbi:MAG TPA: AAA family ATPase, partial [Thermoanaerobaculia bacterium]